MRKPQTAFFLLFTNHIKEKKKHCLQGHREHQQHQLSQLDSFTPVDKEKSN